MQFADQHYIKPSTFLGVGGLKIFRDDIWGRLRFVFQADHRYYRKHGIYDFPQKNKAIRETNKAMFSLTKNPEMKEAVRKMLKTQPAEQLKEIVANS